MAEPRIVRAPRGTNLTCKSWLTEAPFRMIQNNLDPEVAQHPEDLVVYGGRGQAARNWECFEAIIETLKILEDDLFANSGAKAPVAVPSDNSTLVRDEAASVVIWNGSNDSSLGDRTSTYLQSQGINVIQVADAGSYHPATKIEIFNGKPYAVDFIAKTMGVASAQIWNSYDPSAGVDIRITLGGDWAANNQLP